MSRPPQLGPAPRPVPRLCAHIVPVPLCPGETLLLGSTLQRRIPTPSGVREILEISPSSSSSLVWNLGIGPVVAGQGRTGAVRPVWGTGVVLLSTRGHLDGCAPVTVVVHDLSPADTRGVPRSCPTR